MKERLKLSTKTRMIRTITKYSIKITLKGKQKKIMIHKNRNNNDN